MRLTAEELELQKKRILESAMQVFIKDGYVSAKMEDIAKGAGVSRSPLYYHFTNRQDLFDAVFFECCDKFEKREKEIYCLNISIFERIYKGLVAAIRNADNDLEGLRMAFVSRQEELPKSYERYILLRKRLKEMKTEKVREAIKAGELKSGCDPEQICDLIFLFYRGTVGEIFISQNSQWSEAYVEKIVAEFVALLRERYEENKI